MLELLAVLLIFAVLLGIVLFPAARWHRQQRIRSAVAVVRSAVQLAREQAMTRREHVSVAFTNMSVVVTNPVTSVVVTNITGSHYWIRCPSGDLTPTNTIPDGVSFYAQTVFSTNGYDGITAQVSDFHHAVCIAGDDASGDWVVFTTHEHDIAFDPSGNATSLRLIGIAESTPPRNSLALTGLVTVAGSTGYITTDPRAP